MKFRFISLLLVGAMMMSCDELGNLNPDEGDKENTENTGGENNGEKPGDNNGENGGEGNGDNTGDNNGEGNGGNNGGDTPVQDPLTPAESRVKLEEVSAELAELLAPDKQKELLEVIDRFYLYSDNLYMEYDSAAAVNAANAAKAAKAAKAFIAPMQAIAKGDIKAASSLTSVQETYAIGLDGALGIYAYDGAEWVYTRSETILEFRFPAGGQNVVINVTPSGEKYKYEHYYSYSEPEWDSWDEEAGEYTHYKEVNGVEIISVPGKVNASVTKGGKTLAEATVEGKYKVGGTPVNSDVKAVVGPYEVTIDADLNTTTLTNVLTFKIDGKTVFSSNSEAKGSFNLDPDFYYEKEAAWENYYEFVTIDDLKITTSILDLNLVVTGKDSRDIEDKLRKLDAVAKENESESELEPGMPYSISQNHVSKICAVINDATEIEASYGDGPVFAKIEMKATYSEEVHYDDYYWRQDDWNGDGIIQDDEMWTDWTCEYIEGYTPAPILIFEDDGASFSIAEFFNEEDFTNVISDFDNLMKLYENCLPNIWADFEEELEPDHGVEPMN